MSDALQGVNAVLVPGGFGHRGVEGMVEVEELAQRLSDLTASGVE